MILLHLNCILFFSVAESYSSMRPTSWEKAGGSSHPPTLLLSGPTEVITISDSEEEEDREVTAAAAIHQRPSPDIKPLSSASTVLITTTTSSSSSILATSGGDSGVGSSTVVVELSGGSGPTSGCPSVMTLTPGGAGTAPPALQDSEGEGSGYFPPSNLSTPSRDLVVGPLAAPDSVGRTPIKSEPGSGNNITTSTPGKWQIMLSTSVFFSLFFSRNPVTNYGTEIFF